MRLQDYMIDVTKAAAAEAFKCARATAADKLDWSPMDKGRSVLNQCREMAMCPKWAEDIIGDAPQAEWTEETAAAMQAEQEQWKTIDECEAECNKRLESLYQMFRNMPDEKLKETKWLPYDGGRDFTMAEMMDYPHWNFTYHLGQISYIQTLYGDKEMH
jgi:hypothetical protein